jgi:HPt (histidine-containing phosphotransfer) domain-containing protein
MPTPSSATDIDVLNRSTLEELHAILEDALLEIVQAFLDGLDAEVESVAQACNQDAITLRRSAHSLKGSAANMGAKALSQMSSRIERLAIDGHTDACRPLIPELRQVAEQTKQALQHYLQNQ